MTANIKISIKKLYKIFGPDPEMALQHVKNGVEKPELLEQHDHVLGLKDINIDILDGQVTVIMGLSGSGKSTLIRHFNRLIEPTDGQILIDGINVMDLSNEELRKMRQSDMSMVFQNFALLPHKTVLENAGTALRVRGVSTEEADLEAKKWLDRVGLTGFEGHYPHQLSGGMQQRVGIARALTSNSAVMLMDEAFSALDPLIRNDMQDLLLELQKELHKTIIFISHDLDEALKLADHLVILKDGEVIQQGEPQHILLNPCDPYIESFVSEINRVRVLRVRSVMQPLPDNSLDTAGSVDVNATLEDVISHSGGDTNKVYLVKKEGEAVGTICMKDLVRALVPRVPSQKETITA
ncbi:betaine/proline/choline family ABC transporter ATP-binding protein [uncultured Alteromonas sp.]|jgi:glycine betaine/proline transport system ATP-binding protein|uniref:betaine/proline/choline family ABC transporter ATP-binding protein n=1 Tax=uncultured Alteromonas sp. TaxID=179113 RepID=UPI00258B27DC|nr:betaine/proline/choline family ABC transporter ATP-binding protein [uncultured Alteromonas sp.]